MKEIIKSEFVHAVNETKMTRKELAAKYELPETEIKKIMKAFGLKISRKQHVTYVIVDDTATTETLASNEVAVDITPSTPFTEVFATPDFVESQVN